MGDDSCLWGRGFESRHRILDIHDIFHIVLFVCLKRPKINKKRLGLAHFFKKKNRRDSNLFVMGHFQPLFIYFFHFFNTVDSKWLFTYKFANVWIRTADLWYRKRPLCTLNHTSAIAGAKYFRASYQILIWLGNVLERYFTTLTSLSMSRYNKNLE